MTLPDFLGHVGYVSIFLGLILITQKNAWGFALRALGEILWMIVGLMLNLSSAYYWGFIFLTVEAYGFFKWRREQKEGDVAQPGRAAPS